MVSGTAPITVNDGQLLLRTNESTFIRMGDGLLVENPGKIDFHLIGVQAGEDDVVRKSWSIKGEVINCCHIKKQLF